MILGNDNWFESKANWVEPSTKLNHNQYLPIWVKDNNI